MVIYDGGEKVEKRRGAEERQRTGSVDGAGGLRLSARCLLSRPSRSLFLSRGGERTKQHTDQGYIYYVYQTHLTLYRLTQYPHSAYSTTTVRPTGTVLNASSLTPSFSRALAKSIGGMLYASSDMIQVPQCTPILFFAPRLSAIRTAPSGSVCWRCMCQRGS